MCSGLYDVLWITVWCQKQALVQFWGCISQMVAHSSRVVHLQMLISWNHHDQSNGEMLFGLMWCERHKQDFVFNKVTKESALVLYFLTPKQKLVMTSCMRGKLEFPCMHPCMWQQVNPTAFANLMQIFCKVDCYSAAPLVQHLSYHSRG